MSNTFKLVKILKGPLGFGFSVGESEMGPVVTQILDHPRCDQLREGDIIVEVNGEKVIHYIFNNVVKILEICPVGQEVTFLVERQQAEGEVNLGAHRETPNIKEAELNGSMSGPPKGPRNVTVHKTKPKTGFGFVLQSNTRRAGCVICRLKPGSPAEKCNQLYLFDELLSVNGKDVSRMDHGDIVELVKSSGKSIHLVVQQPDDVDFLKEKQKMKDEQIGSPSPPQQESSLQQQVDGLEGQQNNVSSQSPVKEGEPISSNLTYNASDDDEILQVDIRRSEGSFGFTIRGGAEYMSPLCVLRISPGGAAELDGRLRVGDRLLSINGSDTEKMLHSDAIFIIKHGGDLVKLIVMRVEPDESFISLQVARPNSKSYQLYNEAIKGGYVSVKTSNVLLFGMAGTGKTSTKNLIFDLPPPEKRNSTPLANAAERLLVRKIRNLSGTKVQATQDNWKPITSGKLKQHIADLVLSYIEALSDTPEVSNEVANGEQVTVSPTESNVLSQSVELEINSLQHDNDQISTADIDVSSASLIPLSTTLQEEQDNTNEDFIRYVSNVVSEIQSLVNASSFLKAREVFGSDWVYFIDSGGQPHFHNLLPLFIRDVSAALYVLRLSDQLEDHPLVEYYKDDVLIGDAFRSHLSTADNFKYLVQSIQSHNKDCRLVCIGTHLDQSSKCREKIEKKNQCLFELLPESIIEKCHFNSVNGTEQMILCIDTQVLGDERKKTADNIRKIIRKCPCKEIKVPIWWYNYEIIIENISAEESCKVLSFDQCSDVARTLNFDKDALVEALKFFHHHHIFHYYPDVLPNVLFCDTQVLLDKVTELVEHVAYLRDACKSFSAEGEKFKIRDRGIITLDFLANFPKHYVEGLFGPAELIKVFRYLLIATSFDSVSGQDEYFMPSLLGISEEDELKLVRRNLEKKSTPLFIQFKNGWPRCGVFCCLQVYLIKEHQWSLGKILSKNKPKQNVVKMFLPNNPHLVTLIDSITYIEIYVESNKASVCSEVRRTILRGIKCSCKALHYDNEEPELAFLCPDSTRKHRSGLFSKTKHDPHPAVLLAGSGYMRCTQHEYNTYPLEEKHKLWITNLDQGNASLPHPQEVDYSQTDCSHAYNTMVTCSVSLNHALSQEPLALAAALFRTGLISQAVLDETGELNETKNEKGSRLYRTVLATVQNYPTRFAEFVQVLRSNKILYSDVLGELDRTFEHHSLI